MYDAFGDYLIMFSLITLSDGMSLLTPTSMITKFSELFLKIKQILSIITRIRSACV